MGGVNNQVMSLFKTENYNKAKRAETAYGS